MTSLNRATVTPEEIIVLNTTKKTTAALAVVIAATFAFTACSSGDSEPTGNETTPAEDMTDESMPAETETEEPMDASADLVGPGCADYAEAVPDGAGSVEGMAADPVAVAASNNPLLTTLTAAVSGELNPDVNLVDTLNGSEFTVFAPVDDAFAEVDPDTIETLKTDSDLLTTVLTYHVVPGQIAPEDLAGALTTVEGDDVEISGSGDDLMVNDASVICGGVKTANATVYLIDSVLMPPM